MTFRRQKIIKIVNKNSSTVLIPCNLKKYTGYSRETTWRVAPMAVDVLPNPSDPQMFNIRVNSVITNAINFSSSVKRGQHFEYMAWVMSLRFINDKINLRVYPHC